ncbi:MAG: hypothetical protein ACRDIB_04760 [Ardenticatenaceae bacterium]
MFGFALVAAAFLLWGSYVQAQERSFISRPPATPPADPSADSDLPEEEFAIVEGGPLSQALQEMLRSTLPQGVALHLAQDVASIPKSSDASEYRPSAEVWYAFSGGGFADIWQKTLPAGESLDIKAFSPGGEGYETWPDGTEAVVNGSSEAFVQVSFVKQHILTSLIVMREPRNLNAQIPMTIDQVRSWGQAIAAQIPGS